MSIASKITQLFAVSLLSVSLFSSLNAQAAGPTKRLVASTLAALVTCAPIHDLPTFSCYGTVPEDYMIPVSIKAKLALNEGVNCHFFDNSRTFACDNIPVTHLSADRMAPVYFNVNNFRFERTRLEVFVPKM